MTLTAIQAVQVNDETIDLRRLLQLARLEDGLPVFESLIRYALIRQYAQKHDIRVEDEAFYAALDEFRRRLDLHKAETTRSWLQHNRLRLEEVGEWIEDRVRLEQVKDHIAHGRMERYYEEHRASFDLAVIRRIATSEEGEARELILALEDGADFWSLARDHSVDEHTREVGGYIGWVRRSELSGEIEAAVFGASAGSVCGPFPYQDRFQIIRVDKLQPAELSDRVRGFIRDKLFGEWLEDAHKHARIELPLLDYLA